MAAERAHVARRLCHQFPWLPDCGAALGLALYDHLIMKAVAPSKSKDRTLVIQVGFEHPVIGWFCFSMAFCIWLVDCTR